MFYVVYTIPHPVYGMFTTSFSFIHIYLEGLRNDKWYTVVYLPVYLISQILMLKATKLILGTNKKVTKLYK